MSRNSIYLQMKPSILADSICIIWIKKDSNQERTDSLKKFLQKFLTSSNLPGDIMDYIDISLYLNSQYLALMTRIKDVTLALWINKKTLGYFEVIVLT